MNRPYDDIESRVAVVGDRSQRMRAVVDLLWDALHATGVSWVGFYVPDGPDAMVLGPCRDKPACSPIGMHGVCGRAFREGRPIVVEDVAALGENYVACDPRDRSELVVPCFDDDGRSWGVLDLDSHAVGAFDARDVDGLTRVLVDAGLTASSGANDDE